MADPYGNIPPPYMGPPNAPTHPQDSPSIEFAPFFGDFVPISSPTPQDDQLAAIEEEKRRRNTAASARFRIKKKEREQALEQTAAEMTEKVVGLEAKVGQLELENKWLRGLITEKSKNVVGGKAGESSKKDSKGKKSEDKSRGPGKHTDGVGTA
ncbi:hypothetical protein EJ06DRAFT_526467 [Trichodelitschia bisporula]|uniref:BZIP domain-containing protein n=1 Tax=Trichodelitschia bisporula TaxID=703511 RepID=A0A6G1I7W4_9PEZI|nr:hypothetical protein EJ06DRAFT_526467 [Trichodelitschia bisporula]